MYENILYFIVAILVYSTYQPPGTPFLNPMQTLALFIVFALFFILVTKRTFSRLISGARQSRRIFDLSLANAATRQSVMAIMVFTIDIYGLNLPAYVEQAEIFKLIPTLGVALFFILFTLYMAVVWTMTHDAQVRIHGTGITRRQFLSTNLMFAIPVILPWFLLSLILDLIGVLPLGRFKPFYDSTFGQIAVFMIFLSGIALAGPWLIIKTWGCAPLPIGPARKRITGLCKKAKISFAGIMNWPLAGGRIMTAGVMGIFKKFRYLLITPALLEVLSEDEIDGVISHEIGHVLHHHMFFYFIFLAGYIIISYTLLNLTSLLTLFAQIAFFTPMPSSSTSTGLASFAFGACLVLTFVLYFRYGFGYFMRNFERQADIAVYPLMGSAIPLISTFYKIASFSGQSPDRPNWHHFSINERIGFLKKCEQDEKWIKRHHKKVRVSVAAYLITMTLFGTICIQMNFGETGRRVSKNIIEKALVFAAARNPDKAFHLAALSDFYYSENRYADAVKTYKKTLAVDKRNLRALNNLAWLYTTCPTKGLRRPATALKLAQRAASLSEAPHVLDTLAEALYANRFYGPAVIVSTRAANTADKNRGYYIKQLERFREALRENAADP
ncbi:MAG: M48 family metalloprotease [Deltaproteobacteria bacterium]|nr:M48 family metalloprotease [Deltaproteobacteria bacterium]